MTANELKAVMAKLDRLLDENDRLRAERDRLRKLVSYLAGENTDHVQVHLSGNPIVCDAVIAEARAALKGGNDE